MDIPSPPLPVSILLLTKAPRPGLVKTRLAASIGEAHSVRLHCLMVERQLQAVPCGWPVEVHFAPDDAGAEMRAWLGDGYVYFPQVPGDLGRRLDHAIGEALGRSPGGVMAIGGDCPELGAEDLRHAAGMLPAADVVLGPALDGGFYLIGMRRRLPGVFANIPWSTPGAAAAVLARAAEAGLSVAQLPLREDVDDLASLRRVAARLGPKKGSNPTF